MHSNIILFYLTGSLDVRYPLALVSCSLSVKIEVSFFSSLRAPLFALISDSMVAAFPEILNCSFEVAS